MGVPCPGCGRTYDVTLFQFGRTIDCTCGERVRMQPLIRRHEPAIAPRFAADAMLGRLARWLRILGFDTRFDAAISDAALVQQALVEQRVILTRDRKLTLEWTIPRLLVVSSQSPLDQLAEVVAAFSLDWRSGLFTRCNRCNTPLDAIDAERAQLRVPERVRLEQRAFKHCSGCDRIYWRGSHVDRIRERLEARLG
jgi:uncharacterized protein with PIN domain